MCGRYVLYGPENRIIEGFTLFEPDPFAKAFSKPFTPRYNIAPTTDVWVVSANAQNQRELRNVRWGLIPNWAKDASIGAKMNNARAETVAEKPSFRNAFKRSRCLIPANGFYEWHTSTVDGKIRKQPHYIHAVDDGLLAFAGLTERWMGPDGPVYTCCIITTHPNAVMEPIHERMPVILGSADFERWLSPQNRDVDALNELLKPCPAQWLAAHPVDSRVNQARNDDASLIFPSIVAPGSPATTPTTITAASPPPQSPAASS
jgi:putative SOS response-associated peptidase YedK